MNGERAPADAWLQAEGESDDLVCQYWAVAASEWPAGETVLETTVTYLELVDDGLSDYPPGTQNFVYRVSAP